MSEQGDEHLRSRTRVEMRRLLVGLVRQCNDFDAPFDAARLRPELMRVFELAGVLAPVFTILERFELATFQDQAAGDVESATYVAVMRDLLRLRALLGMER